MGNDFTTAIAQVDIITAWGKIAYTNIWIQRDAETAVNKCLNIDSRVHQHSCQGKEEQTLVLLAVTSAEILQEKHKSCRYGRLRPLIVLTPQIYHTYL